jgi:hypothetical protein
VDVILLGYTDVIKAIGHAGMKLVVVMGIN